MTPEITYIQTFKFLMVYNRRNAQPQFSTFRYAWHSCCFPGYRTYSKYGYTNG